MKVYTDKDYEGPENLARMERQLILKAARRFGNHQERMTLALGITARTLYNKLIQHQIEL